MKAAGIEPEKSISYIHEYFDSFIGKNVVPHLRRIIRIFGLAKKMPKVFLKMVDSSFSPAAGFAYEWPEAGENEARFNIVKCPYFETCKRYGRPEITVVYCDADDVTYGNMHPRLKWGAQKRSAVAMIAAISCCNIGNDRLHIVKTCTVALPPSKS